MSEKLSERLEALCAIKGRPFTVAERAESLILMSRAAAALRAVEGDAARLDWLEQTARHGGIFLYNGVDTKREKQTAVGLGLRPGRMDRSLRQAIDQARNVPLDAAGSAEGVS